MPAATMRQALVGAFLALAALAPARAADPADWADLARFAAANTTLMAAPPDPRRVVFMGDSITQGWRDGDREFFADPTRVNRGISGQTTPQMLVRFRQDVIALKPRAVVILAGTNDIAGNTGPATDEQIAGHVASMVELARAHGIRVLLLSVLPADRYDWNPPARPAARIVRLNGLVADYARRQGIAFVDLHTPMKTPGDGLRREYGEDGVHPNEAGYRAMRGPVLEALAALLGG